MNERVAAMVRAAIAKNPQVDNAELRRRAAEIDRAVRRLSPRQFHATYRLPALRSVTAASSTPAAQGGAARGGAARGGAKSAAKSATPPTTSTARSASAPTARPAKPAETPAAVTSAPTPAARAEASTAPTETTPSQAPAAPAAPAAQSLQPPPSKALARPHAAEREAVRAILQTVAREALATEDRAAFVRLLDSLDERANVILGLFGRA
jgi:hypothetical protein